MYECITCKVNSYLSNYCTFTISYVTTNTQKYKIPSIKNIILGGHSVALVGQAKDFHEHHIWCFPLPCTGDKISLNATPSPAMISYDVLTCSIHGIQQRHLILWSMNMIIYFPPPFSKKRTSSTGFRHWEYGGRNSTVILSCTANQSLTMLVRWKRLRSTVKLTKCTAIVYLDILVPQLLHSFAIPLKCHLVELFHCHLMSLQNSVYGENADIIYICEDIVIYD